MTASNDQTIRIWKNFPSRKKEVRKSPGCSKLDLFDQIR